MIKWLHKLFESVRLTDQEKIEFVKSFDEFLNT